MKKEVENMLCVISFIFILIVAAQLEADSITIGQALFYGIYGLIMFYHTSHELADCENDEKNKKRKEIKNK